MSLIKHIIKHINKLNLKCLLGSSIPYQLHRRQLSKLAPIRFGNSSELSRQTILTSIYPSRSYFPAYICNLNLLHHYRSFSLTSKSNNDDDNDDPKKRRPALLKFGAPIIAYPTFFLLIKNWLSMIFIQLELDSKFSLEEFQEGSKAAVEVISQKLGAGDYAGLKNLVERQELNRLEQLISTMTVAQRNILPAVKDDIYISFPYEMGLIKQETTENGTPKIRYYAEIMMVYYVYKGAKELKEQAKKQGFFVTLRNVEEDFTTKRMVCNYKFIKEFTKGVEDDWTANHIVYYMPDDDTPK